MPKRRQGSRLYYRDGRGYYADFRDYADVGGRQEAMIAPGQSFATHDVDLATELCRRRLERLQQARKGAVGEADPRLIPYAKRHLRLKKRTAKPSTIRRHKDALHNVIDFFGEDVRLSQITVRRLEAYIEHREQQPGISEGTKISPQTIIHELNALSSVFQRAVAEHAAEHNPVRSIPDPPRITAADRDERVWLEFGEAYRLLEACRALDADDEGRRPAYLEAVVALFLLTGARKSEGLGVLRGDVDFEQGDVWIRENRFRRVKGTSKTRRVPLWPQLRAILERHVQSDMAPEDPLFPSPRADGPVTSIRRSLGRALERAEIEKHVTYHTFRHTYTAARLQTLDGGAPVSPWTVARELGHSDLGMLKRVYGHLMRVRYRSPVVEYREAKVLQLELRERAS